jgi:hypothetical protein
MLGILLCGNKVLGFVYQPSYTNFYGSVILFIILIFILRLFILRLHIGLYG